jgi:hypothetical protein
MMAIIWSTMVMSGVPVTTSVSDILCAGFFAARFRMLIRFLFFALSDVLVPGFPGGLA